MVKERLMTVGEVASYLSCSISTVRRLVARGRIPHYRLGRMVRFRRGELDSWLARQHGGDLPAEVSPGLEESDQLSLFEVEPIPLS